MTVRNIQSGLLRYIRMENNLSLEQAKESIKSKKNGDLIRLEFFGEDKIISDGNIFYDSAIHDVETAMWLLDETPQLVFAISGKINHEFNDYTTILLSFKNNKTVIISSDWVTTYDKKRCNVICTNGKVSLELQTNKTIIETEYRNNALKVTEAAFLSSQKGIPIYLE